MGRADSPLRDRVIFVEGAPRSGTTLLASFVGSHPEVAGTVAESHLFDRGVGQLLSNHGASGYLDNYIDADDLADLARDLCDGVLVSMRRRVKPEAGWVAEKTPVPPEDAERLLRQKAEVYPDAHYLHVAREPEAAVRSMIRAPWNEQDEAGSREWQRTGVAAIRAELGGLDRYREIAYEELSERPREVMADVYRSLGLAVSDEALSRVEALSHEWISGFAPEPSPAPVAGTLRRRRLGGRRLRGLRASLRSRVDRRARCAQGLIVAMRERDAAAIELLTDEELELTVRSGAGDARAVGGEARELLRALGEAVFSRQFATESWLLVSRSGVSTLMLTASHGDGSRADMTFGCLVRGGRVSRLAVIAAGDPSGREPERWTGWRR